MNTDYWPNAQITLQLAPWTWHWRPVVWWQEGGCGAWVLCFEISVNWLSRRLRG